MFKFVVVLRSVISKNILFNKEASMKQIITIILVLFSVTTKMQQLVAAQPAQPRASTKEKLIAHGRYLVESAAPCGDCHTLRNQRGELVQEKALQGAPILFKPTVPVPEWVDRAPNIAG